MSAPPKYRTTAHVLQYRLLDGKPSVVTPAPPDPAVPNGPGETEYEWILMDTQIGMVGGSLRVLEERDFSNINPAPVFFWTWCRGPKKKAEERRSA